MRADNAQACVDTGSHLIVENHLTQDPKDKQELVPVLDRLKGAERCLGRPAGLLVDAGCFSEDNVKRCAAAGVTF